jgi:hypothetical protein
MEPLTMQQSPVEKPACDYLDTGINPRYAVTENPSDDFQVASRHVFAWFNDKHDVLYFITDRLCYIWDINLGVKVL